jgi:hypothetical protein
MAHIRSFCFDLNQKLAASRSYKSVNDSVLKPDPEVADSGAKARNPFFVFGSFMQCGHFQEDADSKAFLQDRHFFIILFGSASRIHRIGRAVTGR